MAAATDTYVKLQVPIDIIATERLILRSAQPEDFESLHRGIFSDAEVMRYLRGSPYLVDQSKQFFEDEFDHQGTGRKIGVLIERSTQTIIGYAGLKPFRALGAEDLEVGFVLTRSAWGRGYATEIGGAQLEYGFRTTNQSRLVAQVKHANIDSAKALVKIGMKLLKDYERPSLGRWDIYLCHRAYSNG